MAPEAPGNLVALDVTTDPGGFVCRVERYDPVASNEFLRVSWNAIARPTGYEPVADGAAYVDVPPGFDHRVYEARPDVVGPRFGLVRQGVRRWPYVDRYPSLWVCGDQLPRR